MADTAFSVKIDGKLLTVDKITLGDWRLLKTEFGLNTSDIVVDLPPNAQGEVQQSLNVEDPNVLIGLLVVALHHERPLAPVSTLTAEIEALSIDGFGFPDADTENEADPTPAVENAATEKKQKGRK